MDHQTGIEFSRQHKGLWRNTVVDEHGPGTVLHNLDAFLAFIEERDTPLTGVHQALEVTYALWTR
jgi:hypothetical protein